MMSAGLIALCLWDGALQLDVPAEEEVRLKDAVVWVNPGNVTITTRGTILSETDEAVTIQETRGTRFSLKRDRIQEIKHRNPPDRVYAVKKKKLAGVLDRESRAARHLEIGFWCVRPHLALEGEPPMPEKAFEHLYKAVQIDPGRKEAREAFPYLLDQLAREREGVLPPSPASPMLEREVDVYMLAAAGGYEDPEIDFRLAEILHGRLGMTEEAVKLFEKVRGSSGERQASHSLVRRARRYLASIYLERGEIERVSSLFSPSLADPKDPASFESIYETARLFAHRGTIEDWKRARELFQKALDLQPDLPAIARELSALDYGEGKLVPAEVRLARMVQGGADDPGLQVDLALIQIRAGKFTSALSLPKLAGAAPEVEPREEARAHIAWGLIHEYQKNAAGALLEYQKARSLDPSSSTAALLLGGAQLATGDSAGARATLAALIKANAARRGLFAAYARVLADVEIASGQRSKALNLLEYAAQIDSQDPLLRRKIGVLCLAQGELDRAHGHLEAAAKVSEKLKGGPDPALLNAQGCYHYRRGDFAKARALFERVKGMVPRPQAQDGTPPVSPERLYAEMALGLAEDAQKLEVWLDDFNREPSSEVARNWRELESFGIAVSIQGERVIFQGEQSNDPSGVTMLVREEPVENVERLEARFSFFNASSGVSSGPVRAGLRIEAVEGRGGAPSSGLVFFRDHDGTLGYARKTTRGGWEDAQPTPDQDPSKGKPVFARNVRWPADSQLHTLAIRKISVPSQSQPAFDLLLDGRPVAQNVVVEGLRGKAFLVGVSGQAESLGARYRFEADAFRLYRLKALSERLKER